MARRVREKREPGVLLNVEAARVSRSFQISILNPPEQQRGAEARDDCADREEAQVARDGWQSGLPEADHAKCVAEMRERESLRNEADAVGELLERCECAGEREDGQEIEDGELDRLRLRAAERGDEQAGAERAEQEEQAEHGDEQRRAVEDLKMVAARGERGADEDDRDGEVWDDLSDHDFLAAQRCDEEL